MFYAMTLTIRSWLKIKSKSLVFVELRLAFSIFLKRTLKLSVMYSIMSPNSKDNSCDSLLPQSQVIEEELDNNIGTNQENIE